MYTELVSAHSLLDEGSMDMSPVKEAVHQDERVNFHKNNHKAGKLPRAYYEQLMRHDWFTRVNHRIRQRGWGK